jgi:hypothetical protein
LCVLLTAGLWAAVVSAGCASRISGEPLGSGQPATHRALVTGYFDAINAAAAQGSAAQEQLFAHTQHPDFRDLRCSLQGLTVTTDPAYSTLHADPDWRPPQTGRPPRGTVYVVAVTVTVQRSTAVLASQVGSLHVVVLDGTAYGFAPCPA